MRKCHLRKTEGRNCPFCLKTIVCEIYSTECATAGPGGQWFICLILLKIKSNFLWVFEGQNDFLLMKNNTTEHTWLMQALGHYGQTLMFSMIFYNLKFDGVNGKNIVKAQNQIF